jgi:alcohol dehydrogenase class IV
MLSSRLQLDRLILPKESLYGSASLKGLSGVQNAKTIVIHSRSAASNSSFSLVGKYLGSAEVLFHELVIEGEPNRDTIECLAKILEDHRPDAIVSVGGGSILDSSKLACLLYEHGNLNSHQLRRPFGSGTIQNIDHYAIPTTLSGSETSSAAVYLEGNSKIPVVSHDFLPRAFFLDPAFIQTLPSSLKVETALDAFTHAVEGFTSKVPHPLMDVFAIEAIRLLRVNLGRSLENPASLEFLQGLQIAGMLAGVVQNHCLTGVCHSIAHCLSQYGISHGRLNALHISEVIGANCELDAAHNRYEQLFLGAGFKGVDEARVFVAEVLERGNIKRIEAAKMVEILSRENIDTMLDDRLTAVNIELIDEEVLIKIIERSNEI